MCQPPHPRHTQRFAPRRAYVGLLACLTAAALTGIVMVRLDTQQSGTDEVYLKNSTPIPAASTALAAPRTTSQASVGRPPLAHVARPGPGSADSARPQPSPTATRPRSSIDGFGGEQPAGTSVGAASGGREIGTDGGDDRDDG